MRRKKTFCPRIISAPFIITEYAITSTMCLPVCIIA